MVVANQQRLRRTRCGVGPSLTRRASIVNGDFETTANASAVFCYHEADRRCTNQSITASKKTKERQT